MTNIFNSQALKIVHIVPKSLCWHVLWNLEIQKDSTIIVIQCDSPYWQMGLAHDGAAHGVMGTPWLRHLYANEPPVTMTFCLLLCCLRSDEAQPIKGNCEKLVKLLCKQFYIFTSSREWLCNQTCPHLLYSTSVKEKVCLIEVECLQSFRKRQKLHAHYTHTHTNRLGLILGF